MKRAGVALFIMTAFVTAAMAAPPSTLKDFQYCAEVAGPVRMDSLYQVHLTGAVLEKSGAGQEDVRLFSPSGKEVPFVLIENAPSAEAAETYPLEITGYSGGPSSAVITMRLPEKHRPISVISLDIPDIDFKKRAVLSGSGDGKAWQALAEDAIYDFSSQVDLRKTKVEFPATDFRYFRLRLIDAKPAGAGDTSIRLKYEGLDFSVNGGMNKELRIHEAQGGTAAPGEKTAVYDERAFAKPQATQDKDGNTVVLIKAGLPADRFSFQISNPYYYRLVSISASDTGKEDSYLPVARGAIYRFPLSAGQHEAKTALDVRMPKRGYCKIVIENRNSPPLEVKGVTVAWIRKDVYFIALGNEGRHSLCFGNPEAARPDYDLAHFVNSATLPRHPYERLNPGSIKENAEYEPPVPGGRRAKVETLVLKAVVVLLVIGIGFWLYALMRKAGEKR